MPIIKENGKKCGLQKYRVRINYTDHSGKSKTKSRIVYGKQEAQDELEKLHNEVNILKNYTLKKQTILDLYNEYIIFKKSDVKESSLNKSKQILSNHVLNYLGNYYLDKIDAVLFQKWKLYIENKSISVTMKQNIYGELRCMLNYALRMGYLQNNPLVRLSNFKDTSIIVKQKDFYTADEFKKFIEVAKQFAEFYEQKNHSLFEWNYYVFFNIAFYMGMRKGEIHALKWADIDGNFMSITKSIGQKIRKGEDVETGPKNKYSIRTIEMPEPLMQILKEHKERAMLQDKFSDSLKVLGGNKCLRDTSLRNRSIKYANHAGIKTIRIHDFRHSHVSVLANSDINIQIVAKRIGHAKIEETWNTYSHLYPKAEEKAICVLNNV